MFFHQNVNKMLVLNKSIDIMMYFYCLETRDIFLMGNHFNDGNLTANILFCFEWKTPSSTVFRTKYFPRATFNNIAASFETIFSGK